MTLRMKVIIPTTKKVKKGMKLIKRLYSGTWLIKTLATTYSQNKKLNMPVVIIRAFFTFILS
jgi:hypothetical protein